MLLTMLAMLMMMNMSFDCDAGNDGGGGDDDDAGVHCCFSACGLLHPNVLGDATTLDP
jgi:hypothetical protein